ncbi:MAG: type 1 glutamine amidotransferase [Burkholderiaceae bacterium]|nr:type 1 glutamine amidotransferase [Burkholderiaceae bacterium]
MPARPLKIGLSARLMHKPPAELGFRNRTLQYLEQTIAHWIMAHGALVLMIPTLSTSAELSRRGVSVRAYVRELDGLVLQGGADVCPRSYGKQPMRAEWAGDIERDRYEMELMHEFMVQGKPVLGICRGAQLMNVALGGTLFQDIATQCPQAIAHVDPVLYDELCHEISFEADSRIRSLYENLEVARVTSIHHQAVDRLGSDLVVDARSTRDGIIEAIRWRGAGYAMGLQWHPEFHDRGKNLLDSSPIVLDFLAAAERMREPA